MIKIHKDRFILRPKQVIEQGQVESKLVSNLTVF